MINRMKASIFTLTLILGACSHYNEDLAALDKTMGTQDVAMIAPQDIAPAAGDETGTTPGTLTQYLAREYYDLAKFENEQAYDYKAAKGYTKKAVMASKGETTVPAKVSAFDIPKDKIPALTQAREALITALKENNTPENQMALAKAQSRFDCWLEREEEAADDGHCASCRSEFEQAMATLIAPAAGISGEMIPQQSSNFDISFAQNSAAFDDVSMATIKQISAFMNAPENAGYGLTLTGYSAASGQGEFATKLATARVKMVRDGLVANGIAPERVMANVASPAPQAGVVPVSAASEQAEMYRKVQIVLVQPQVASGVIAPMIEQSSKPAPAVLPQTN